MENQRVDIVQRNVIEKHQKMIIIREAHNVYQIKFGLVEGNVYGWKLKAHTMAIWNKRRTVERSLGDSWVTKPTSKWLIACSCNYPSNLLNLELMRIYRGRPGVGIKRAFTNYLLEHVHVISCTICYFPLQCPETLALVAKK